MKIPSLYAQPEPLGLTDLIVTEDISAAIANQRTTKSELQLVLDLFSNYLTLQVNNLSDLTNASAARVNLGLGSSSAPTFTGLTLSGISASTVLGSNGTKDVVSITNGTANQLLGMNNSAAGPEYKTVAAGANVTVVHGAGTITISSTGAGTVAGTDKQVIFNDGGVYAGSLEFVFDKTLKRLGLTTTVPQATLSLGLDVGVKFLVYDAGSGSVQHGMGIDLVEFSGRELSIFHSSSDDANGSINFGRRLESTGVYTSLARLNVSGLELPSLTASTLIASDSGKTLVSIANGTANQVFGRNNANNAFEYKTVTAGANVTVTHGANSITIASTAASAVAGSDKQVIFNDGGAYAGNASLTFDKTSGVLSHGTATGERIYLYDAGAGSVRAGFGVNMSGNDRENSIFFTTTGTNGSIGFGSRLESSGVFTHRARFDVNGLSLLTGSAERLYIYDAGAGSVRSGFGVDLSGGSRELSIFHTTSDGSTGRISFGKRLESSGAYTEIASITPSVSTFGDLTVSSGKSLTLGNSATAETPTATHTIIIKDSTGTPYRVLCIAV